MAVTEIHIGDRVTIVWFRWQVSYPRCWMCFRYFLSYQQLGTS